MALNPFFLQGTQSEQRLVQDLINEQLQIYGVEVTYIPRKMVNRSTIIEEVTSSKFDDNFLLEAYVNTYEGYGGQGDVLTKFGMSLRDEVTLTVSRERFEDFIVPFMDAVADDEIAPEAALRPREGDLIHFPLGQRLFEVKFVEHEDPFYQLGKNYVYQLKCELFEYEDEIIDTSIEAIDTLIEDTGFITTLTLAGAGVTATATANLSAPGSGFISNIYLNDDGSGYLSAPSVYITGAPSGGVNATAVAITTTRAGLYSVKEVLVTNPGAGYTTPPTISFVGGGGAGAAATASVNTTQRGVISYSITEQGGGYWTTPTVGIVTAPVGGINASSRAIVNTSGALTGFYIINPGAGYTAAPAVTISDPTVTANGDYAINDIVRGLTSGLEARVKSWDRDTRELKVSQVGVGGTALMFANGETIQSLDSTYFISGVTASGNIGVTTNLITGITTTGLVVGQELNSVNNVIGVGATILSIGASQVVMSVNSLNTSAVTGTSLSYGSTAMVAYPLKIYNETDTDDPYNEGDLFETEADNILDFTQTNPFGTY